ncbi:hypothetical protein ExPUPEC87_02040 [Escherichia coli]|nr:hypothetical protein ExPUPEC87_02040 [Escherichia coli]
MLKDHSHFLPDALNIADIFIKFDAIHHDPSLLMFFQMINTTNGCRFTGTRRATQNDPFSRLHG